MPPKPFFFIINYAWNSIDFNWIGLFVQFSSPNDRTESRWYHATLAPNSLMSEFLSRRWQARWQPTLHKGQTRRNNPDGRRKSEKQTERFFSQLSTSEALWFVMNIAMAMAASILAGVGFPFQPSFGGGDVCRLQSSEQKGAKGAFSHNLTVSNCI